MFPVTPGLSRGIATILVTTFAMALADALIKLASAQMTLWQIWVLRSALVLPVLALLARRCLWPAGLGWVLLRSALLALMYVGIYAALTLLDLSVVAAALYVGPLFILLLSALVLGERVQPVHVIAILLGFGGMLLIVRPLAAGFSPLTLLPVGAAALYAGAAVLTRARCAQVPASALALWLNLTLLGLGSMASAGLWLLRGAAGLPENPFLFGAWPEMGLPDWGLILALAALMIVIGIGLARAYQSPRPQVIATFDYAYLPFAAFWGYVFFLERPDVPTLAGIALIGAAGLVALAAPRADAAANR